MEQASFAERIPVTEASARGIARLAKDAEAGHPVIITRHGKPVAAVVSIEESTPSCGSSPSESPGEGGKRLQPRSATERWVQAVSGSPRRVVGPPAGA